MFIYFAHPIDLVKPASILNSFALKIRDVLVRRFHVVFCPSSAYRMDSQLLVLNRHESIEKLVANNNRTLLNSDFVVFLWDGSVSWGLSYELQLAVTYKKPYIFVDASNLEPIPLYMANLLSGATLIEDETQTNSDNSDCPVAVTMKQALAEIIKEIRLNHMVTYYLQTPMPRVGAQ